MRRAPLAAGTYSNRAVLISRHRQQGEPLRECRDQSWVEGVHGELAAAAGVRCLSVRDFPGSRGRGVPTRRFGRIGEALQDLAGGGAAAGADVCEVRRVRWIRWLSSLKSAAWWTFR